MQRFKKLAATAAVMLTLTGGGVAVTASPAAAHSYQKNHQPCDYHGRCWYEFCKPATGHYLLNRHSCRWMYTIEAGHPTAIPR